MTQGYYRFPTIHSDTVVFVCEDDLWSVGAGGGVARRLTANPGEALRPALSPDGLWLAFTGRDEGGPEVYVMPAVGGPSRRLTFLGAARTQVAGWSPDGAEIIFSSEAGQPFAGMPRLFAVPYLGGDPRVLPTGPALSISYGPRGGAVIARNVTDLARWKRYRGGRTGDLWVSPEGGDDWRRLIKLSGNLAAPIWIGERIFFVSDHEGVGNIYSCLDTGDDLRRHTDHADFYVRHPSSDGRRIVYHAGADLWLLDPASGERRVISVELHSPQPQRKRRFVYATVRGQAFAMGNWDGATVQYGDESGRARLLRYLHDGKRLLLLGDAGGEEALEIHQVDGSAPPRRLDGLDIGRPLRLRPSPKADLAAITNQRHELLLVDLEAATARVLDHSPHGRINGAAWSPDGRWLAYSYPDTRRTRVIRLCEVASGAVHTLTRTLLYDTAPAWDPEGKFLYFIGKRDFDPVRDQAQFAWAFPRMARPYLITLRAELASPFETGGVTKGNGSTKDAKDPKDANAKGADSANTEGEKPEGEQPEGEKIEKPEEKGIQIDLEGIVERVVAFPVPVGIYGQVAGVKGKAIFTSYAMRGALSGNGDDSGRLEVYDFAERSCETLIDGISSFTLSQDARAMAYRSGRRLRVIKAGEKPKDNGGPGRKSGWVDLGRVKVELSPPQEWRQIYREAWRLQRDQFWSEDMSGVDWQAIYLRYLPLIDRVATRGEVSDLLWEMQGELGTSHAYEMGGDYRPSPSYRQGFLGLDMGYDGASDSYTITRVLPGDVWDERASSPLSRPGLGVSAGDRLLAINGRRLGRGRGPGELLVNQAGADLLLTIAPADGGEPRTMTVKAMGSEGLLRYRTWVEANRAAVHAATGGRVGYLHIPNMGPWGYAEFHRGYLMESTREGLVVDVRYNGGGSVSQLLIEKLARRRLGYDVSRWGQPDPYPADSLIGPVVAITNEGAGSDGDIFSHVFKLLGLGPLVGKRTWGGVIGINPIDRLADGAITTQPEYSFWFPDVGWGVENYGTDPTIEVEIAPQDYVAGRDPQLERAIAEALRLMAESPPQLPEFGPRPRLGLPPLPEL
ncbi:PDZ domain-containing protein [Oscillochloris sp. ZM17-4]|uniref:S41 family peptidase n=1 Tax=Oscillochloris sp. ZM17-4 TaxID=2866714 RepID=UPI001C7392E8|nr:S41 family peptidase [Oscillochloris sp. ZM17-4]MBX0329487.1 PDZ domain-containing protein [Oscillochloris sp. ZM17-4]